MSLMPGATPTTATIQTRAAPSRSDRLVPNQDVGPRRCDALVDSRTSNGIDCGASWRRFRCPCRPAVLGDHDGRAVDRRCASSDAHAGQGASTASATAISSRLDAISLRHTQVGFDEASAGPLANGPRSRVRRRARPGVAMRRVVQISAVALALAITGMVPLAAEASAGAPIKAGEHFVGLVN